VAEPRPGTVWSAVCAQSSFGTQLTTFCSESFASCLPPCATITPSATATSEKAQHVPKGCCCCTGVTAPRDRQSIDGAAGPAAAASSAAENTGVRWRGGGGGRAGSSGAAEAKQLRACSSTSVRSLSRSAA
jgi:hypothetical protein